MNSIISILCGVYLIGLGVYIIYFITNFLTTTVHNNNLTIDQLNIPKTQYVRLVVKWCINNICVGKKYNPIITLKYHNNKKLHGTYDFITNEIVIYINTHSTILQLTNTIIHEVVHMTQGRGMKMSKKYSRETQDKGYLNNEYEIQCRTKSSKYDLQCMREVLELSPT